MTNNDAKQIRDAFTRLCKAKVTFYKKESTVKITTDFKDLHGEPLELFAYMAPHSKKIYFTDAGRLYKALLSANQPLQPLVITSLFSSYGLTFLPDYSVLDQQDLPMHERVASMLQASIGVDTLIRTWIGYANKVKEKKNESNTNV